MQYMPEILKIIEGGLKNNSKQVLAYAGLLADKLENEGSNKSANIIRSKLTNKGSNKMLSLSEIEQPIPVDRDSRLSLGDLTFPDLSENKVELPDQLRFKVDEFLSFIEKAHLLTKAGVGITPSMLIYGPPGCGKTKLAQTISAALKLPLITARCDTLISSYLGSTSKNIRSLFDHAASRPCVLFLDDFDALAKARDDQHELGELKRVVVSLLQNIDALPEGTILLAATNHEELLDRAVWRRFAYRIRITLPSHEVRTCLIRDFLHGFEVKSVDALAKVSVGMSGAIIEQACKAAIRNMIINGDNAINQNQLMNRLVQSQYANILNDESVTKEEKVTMLRSKNSKLFTMARLSELLGFSTGKISYLISKEGKKNGEER